MSQANGGPSYGTDLPVQAPPATRPSCCPPDGKSCKGGSKRPPRHTPAPSMTAPLSPMTPGRRRGLWGCCCCLRRPTLWGGLALGLVLVGGLLGMLFNATNREELSLVAMVLGVACVVQTASLLLATLSPPYRKSRAKLVRPLLPFISISHHSMPNPYRVLCCVRRTSWRSVRARSGRCVGWPPCPCQTSSRHSAATSTQVPHKHTQPLSLSIRVDNGGEGRLGNSIRLETRVDPAEEEGGRRTGGTGERDAALHTYVPPCLDYTHNLYLYLI